MRRAWLLLLSPFATQLACTAPPTRGGPPPRDLGAGQTRPGCAGRLVAPTGFVAAEDPSDAVGQMRKPAGEGGLCHARRYRLEAPVTLHRIFSSQNLDRRVNGAWTLEPPHGTREQLRRELGVCTSFSALDTLITCEIPAGSSVVLGLGQSIVCGGDERYPQSSVQQVWLVDADLVASAVRCREEAWAP